MSHPLSRRAWPSAIRALSGFAAALILSVLSGGCAEHEDAGGGTTSQAKVERTPEQLFVDYCAACHGVEGRGDGPLAAELRVAPINLRLLKKNNNGKFDLLRVQRSIEGRGMPRAHGLPDMPVWGREWIREGLSEPEVTARAIRIAGYISSIQD